jgi:glycosyltransferase involved in cell wall biosynthesis
MLCWNRLPLSRACLSSYLETISVTHELFVVDNASTDATPQWLETVRTLPGVTGVVRKERNDPAAALNEALGRCNGRLLHIMENDYVYLAGWDTYVLDRFARISQLGQMGLFEGDPRVHASLHEGLVHLARANVCTTSVLRRELFFDHGVRVHGHYLRNLYPDDHDLSQQVLRAGWLVAWPDQDLARNVGFEENEYARDPGYYVRNYALKLSSPSRLRGQIREWRRLDFHQTATLVKRLVNAFRLRLRGR